MNKKENAVNEKKPSIQPAPNGPYLVRGLKNFENSKGALEAKPKMALCRCGGSKNKPYCDGTHAENGFSDAKQEGRTPDKRDNYLGKEITIHDNRGVCAHAGRCTDGLPSVFRLQQEPWIDPDAAEAGSIAQTIRRCPSGALSNSISGEEQRDEKTQASILVSQNGPYLVKGSLQLSDTQFGEGVSTGHFTLCRCGGSKNKPFCDGSHWHIKFTDDKN